MNSIRSFQEDDENDTRLFTKAEEYVLKNYPNPDRIGCPGPAILRAFVESPASVELSEINDLHIMQCAECTRDLIELRRQRSREMERSPIRTAQSIFWNWKLAGIAATLCIVAFCLSILYPRTRTDEEARLSSLPSSPIAEVLDLSGDGVPRGADKTKPQKIALPSRLVNLRLLLPYYSPPGSYRIFVAKEENTSPLIASAEATATAKGPNTELVVAIDLRQVKAGNYFLGTQHLGEGTPYYYPITID